MSSMPDALSSASLLLAALALVYSAWSASIDDEVKRSYSIEDNAKTDQQKVTKKVLDERARPIMIACWLIFFAFLPRCILILWNAIACVRELQCSYDDVPFIFLLTEALVAGLGLHLRSRVADLKEQLTR